MDDEIKKEKNYLDIVLLFLFSVFLILYLSNNSAYSEYKTYEKSMITKESILEFEKDISSGNDVTLKDYVTTDSNDYTNTFNNIGYQTGKMVEKIMNEGIKKTLKILGSLFFD